MLINIICFIIGGSVGFVLACLLASMSRQSRCEEEGLYNSIEKKEGRDDN